MVRLLSSVFHFKVESILVTLSKILYTAVNRNKLILFTSSTGKKCIFQYGKSLENSMFEYPTLDNHWEIYSVPIKVQLFSNTGKMLFIHDLAAGVSLEVYWRTTHLVFQCWTMM